MACCVPGCIYLHQKWAIELPRDKVLLARWKASIKAGTGQCLSNASVQPGASVCSLHFVKQNVDDRYREPSLFIRNNIQLEVACCRLCLRYDATCNMLDMEGCLVQGSSLQWLASKYFWLFQLDKERKGYFCNKCTAQAEMTDAFGQKICGAANKYEKLLQKMATEKMVMNNTSYDHVARKELSETNASVVRKPVLIGCREENKSEMPQPIIVKEEPSVAEPDSTMIAENKDTDLDLEDIFVKEETQLAESALPEADLSTRIVVTEEAPTSVNGGEKSHPVPKKAAKKSQAKQPTNQNDKPLATRTGGKSRRTPMCLICQMTFLQSKEIVTHFEREHPDTSLKTFDCKDCDEVFFTINSYHTHRNYHSNTYACEHCGKKHIARKSLIRHLHIAHKIPFSEDHYLTCPICDQKVRDYNYTAHVRHHTKLGHTADNIEEKRNVETKKYKMLLRKRIKQGVNVSSSKDLTSSESDSNDSKKDENQNEGTMENEDVVKNTNDKTNNDEPQRSEIPQHVSIQEKPIDSEPITLVEVAGADILEDLVMKESPQLTESQEPSDGQKKGATNKSPPFKCYICSTVLGSRATLTDHLKSDHITNKSNTCKECGLVFTKIFSFNMHLSKYDPDKRFKCSQCKYRFNTKENLLKHETSQHGIDHSDKKRKPFPCEKCGKVFYTQLQLDLHLKVQKRKRKRRQVRKPPNPNEKPLATRTGGKGRKTPTCLICQAAFLHSKEIVTHFEQEHPDTELRIIDCLDCDEVFFTLSSYHTHRNYHTDAYACEHCGKKHISRRGLVRHLHIVHEVPFSENHYLTCPICDQKVRDYNYTSHVRHHTKQGQTADNFEEKRNVVAKKYKKLLRKRMKQGLNVGKELSARESDSDTSDSEKGEATRKKGRMDDEDAVEILNDESSKDGQRLSEVPQQVTIKEELDEAGSESITLEEVAEVDVADVLEDLVVKEEPQLTECPPSDGPKKGFKCYICSTILGSRAALSEHLMSDHQTNEANTCKECGLVFHTISGFNIHLSKYDPEKRFKCGLCKYTFNYKDKLMKHETRLHGIDHSDKKRKPFPCGTCGQVFYSELQIKKHLRVKHGIGTKEKALASRGGTGRSVPTCLICQMTFKKSKEVVTHFEQVHPETTLKFFNCEDCDEVFFLAHSLTTHRNTHTAKHACDRCGKRHSSKSDLVRHLHVVHKVPYAEERYRECHVCHQKIRDYNYSAHQRIHRDDGPVYCEHCGKSFKSTWMLGKHNNRCLNEKPLASRTGGKARNMPKCNVCQATFEQMTEVVTHFQLVHPEKDFKTYPCKICGEVLFTYCMLHKHRYMHSTTYACDLCKEISQSKHQLTRHRRSAHGIKPSEDYYATCEVCDHRFTRQDYYRHLKSEKHKINVAKSQALEQQK